MLGRSCPRRVAAVVLAAATASVLITPEAGAETSGARGSGPPAGAPRPPRPVDGLGSDRLLREPAAALRLTTFSPEEAVTDEGLSVYASTAAGTSALTGNVVGPDGRPLPGAAVRISPSRGGPAGSAVTDAHGGFAFVNLPVSGRTQSYDLRVEARAFGPYTVTNEVYRANETYQTSVVLSSDAQSYDASEVSENGTRAAAGYGGRGYRSATKVPPTIKVRMYRHHYGCASGSYMGVQKYPWRYYVLHVAVSEIDTRWTRDAWKAIASAIQNYPWAHRIYGSRINNTTQYQCFTPWRKVPADDAWRRWYEAIHDERVVRHGIQLTQYRAGSYDCRERYYRRNGNIMSQNGARARAYSRSRRCGGRETWRGIIRYYYTGRVRDVAEPRAPRHRYRNAAGGVRFYFRSFGAARYKLQKRSDSCPDCWRTIFKDGWSWKQRRIVRSHKHRTNSCGRYRVAAINAAGRSRYVDYKRGGRICPG